MDITQIILLAVICLLTLLLLFVGIQVFLFIHDLRKTVARANKIVDEIGFFTVSEVLKEAFKARTSKSSHKKTVKTVRKEPEAEINGEHEFEKPLALSLKTPPRFFRGIPQKRR